MEKLKKFTPHILAFLGFVVVALIYFYPVLLGKEIYQPDIVQYIGMAKEQNDFRQAEDTEPYWTNSAFGGMPTYQLGAKYPHNYVKSLDSVLRFLPRPADYLFLYFIGFYILLSALRIKPLKAFIGALAFGFSTYLIIILGVGHNAKAHAIAYMPMVVAGVLLVFQRKYILGGILTMIAAALEIQANHFQMTYYLLFLLIIIGVYYSYKLIKAKDFKPLIYSLGIFLIAGILALGANATNLMATSEYAKVSTRSKSELTVNPDGSPKTSQNAMTYEYITEYSYGKAESLNLIVPRLFGGGNSEKLDENSEVHQYLVNQGIPYEYVGQFRDNFGRTYWGDQPIVAAPAYIGAVVFFLFVLALFVEKRKIKYVFVAGALLSLLLSWGKNFPLLTDFFINNVPMYNKFRAISSIQVILELCIPVLAVLGLASFLKTSKEEQWDSLKKSGIISLGLLVVLLLGKGMFSFTSPNDEYLINYLNQIVQDNSFGYGFMEALQSDRAQMYSSDLVRSILLVIFSGIILFLFHKDKLKTNTAIILIGILMVGDLFLVGKNYVNESSFVHSYEMAEPFKPTPADHVILEDTSHFRVFEFQGAMSSARTSYFHHSVGGYSAVKPKKIQELYDYQIAKGNQQVLNMLNVKYILDTDEEGNAIPMQNDDAYGNAWFVNQVEVVDSADEVIKSLENINKNTAVLNLKDFPIKAKEVANIHFETDSLSSIELIEYKPNYLKYQSQNQNDGLAVFSEIYYPKGWIAMIDGNEAEIFEVNYTLRALQIPKGNHTIEFRFEPQVVKKGSSIALTSSLIMILLIAGGIFYRAKKK
ncbi:MAG: YfhO family protein [Flavobacteriaceae bacterium]